MPLTERIMEAIGLRTHEPVAEVRILCSLQCRKTHAWRCFACQHPQHAQRAVVCACDTIFYALGVPETVSSSALACMLTTYILLMLLNLGMEDVWVSLASLHPGLSGTAKHREESSINYGPFHACPVQRFPACVVFPAAEPGCPAGDQVLGGREADPGGPPGCPGGPPAGRGSPPEGPPGRGSGARSAAAARQARRGGPPAGGPAGQGEGITPWRGGLPLTLTNVNFAGGSGRRHCGGAKLGSSKPKMWVFPYQCIWQSWTMSSCLTSLLRLSVCPRCAVS